MKVIKEGKIPEKEIPKYGLFYRGHCEKCGCEFEAQENEFYEDTKEFFEPTVSLAVSGYKTRERNIYINCPTCKEKIKIKNLEKETKTELWGDSLNKYLK